MDRGHRMDGCTFFQALKQYFAMWGCDLRDHRASISFSGLRPVMRAYSAQLAQGS